MKIALLAPLPPEPSGIANYAAYLKQSLEQLGVSFVIPPAGLPIKQQMDYLRRQGIALAHAEFGAGLTRYFPLAQRLVHAGIPVTATVHDPERLVWRTFGNGWLEKLPALAQKAITLLGHPYSLHQEQQLAKRMHRLIPLTTAGADGLQHKLGVDQARICMIPHGVPDIPPKALPPTQPLRILMFGFLYPGKGIEDLLAAIRLAFDQMPTLAPQLKFTIAGGSKPIMLAGQKVDYVAQLRTKIEQMQLQTAVSVQTDFPEAALPELVQSHHLMILPYRDSQKIRLMGRLYATSGALAWAIACGRGALVSDARAMPSEVAYGNGAAFPQQDPTALAAWLQRLVQQPELVGKWADAAQQLAQSRTWPEIGRRYHEVFQQVMAGTS